MTIIDIEQRIIKAYAHAHKSHENAGDHDIGAEKKGFSSARRKSRMHDIVGVDGSMVKQRVPTWGYEPMITSKTANKSMNTGNIIMCNMKASRIMASAESGPQPGRKHYAIVNYAPKDVSEDARLKFNFHSNRLAMDFMAHLKGQMAIEKIRAGGDVVLLIAQGGVPSAKQISQHRDVWRVLNLLCGRIRNSIINDVGRISFD